MTYILSALVVMGQAIVGLIWLIALSMIAFFITDALGFVGPTGNEKPNPRWQRRQQKAQRKLWGDSAITKRTLARYIGKRYKECARRNQQYGGLAWYARSEEWSIMAEDLREGRIEED